MSQTIQQELLHLSGSGLLRSTRMIAGRQDSTVTVDGRECLLLCSNNYLGLAGHPALADASSRAACLFGTSSGASRLVSGTMALHEELEQAVARFKQTESALLFNSGYAANTGIIPALVGRGDTVFSDRLNHASIVDGIILSGAKMIRYPHNDVQALARLMERQCGKGRVLIVTDGVFSMDGDLAELAGLIELKRRYAAFLMVDDAHGSGVLGSQGRGTAAYLGCTEGIDIQMGTFGKALGSYGAYAAVPDEVRKILINRSRSFIFSTSLPPPVLAASLAALNMVQAPEGEELRKRLHELVQYFREKLRQNGFTVAADPTPIIPLIVGDASVTMDFASALLADGIFLQGIRPPTVPSGTSRLRCTLMAAHTIEELDRAVEWITFHGRSRGIL